MCRKHYVFLVVNPTLLLLLLVHHHQESNSQALILHSFHVNATYTHSTDWQSKHAVTRTSINQIAPTLTSIVHPLPRKCSRSSGGFHAAFQDQTVRIRNQVKCVTNPLRKDGSGSAVDALQPQKHRWILCYLKQHVYARTHWQIEK